MKISIERIRRLLFQATSKLEWLESGEKSCVFTKLRDSFRFRCLTARGKANTTKSYVNRIIKKQDGVVNKTFVQMMEALGYDIVLTYVKRDKNNEMMEE